MKKLLHIIATPRGGESNTLKVSEVFLSEFRKNHTDWKIRELNLSEKKLPPLTAKRVEGKYTLMGGKDLSGDIKDSWQEIIAEIEQFTEADIYLISTPMWNFSIPYMLKNYLDIIMQPGYLFHYTNQGPEGLLKNKKMFVITSRGGDYSTETAKKADFQEPYLRFIFGFAGIADIAFINAEQMNMGEELRKKSIRAAREKAKSAAAGI